jgi:hypothetical protein
MSNVEYNREQENVKSSHLFLSPTAANSDSSIISGLFITERFIE